MSPNRMTITQPDGSQIETPLTSQNLRIGRAADNELVLSDLAVSHYHAQISSDGNNYYVTDLGSANGSYLGEVKLVPNSPTVWSIGVPLHIGQQLLQLNSTGSAVEEISMTANSFTNMSQSSSTVLLRQQIESAYEKVDAQKEGLQRNLKRLKISNILFSASSTFVTGLVTISGQGIVLDGNDGWRVASGLGALLALGATLAGGIQQNLGQTTKLAKINECVAQLRAMKIDLLAPDFDETKIRKQYQLLISQYPEVDW